MNTENFTKNGIGRKEFLIDVILIYIGNAIITSSIDGIREMEIDWRIKIILIILMTLITGYLIIKFLSAEIIKRCINAGVNGKYLKYGAMTFPIVRYFLLYPFMLIGILGYEYQNNLLYIKGIQVLSILLILSYILCIGIIIYCIIKPPKMEEKTIQ